MADRGHITLTSVPLIGALRYDFSTVQLRTPLTFLPEMQTEELTARGLDGTLVGYLHRRFPAFTIEVTISSTSRSAAHQVAENLQGASGYIVQELALSLYGITRRWSSPHLQAVRAMAMADIGSGPFASPSQQAVCAATLSVRPTDIPSR